MMLLQIFADEFSKPLAARAANCILTNPCQLGELMVCLSGEDALLNQKAALTLSTLTDIEPSLFLPYESELLDLLYAPVHVSVKRGILRLFAKIPVSEKLSGRLIDDCFKSLVDAHQPPAVKVYAMTIIASMARKYPELMQELRPVLEEQMPFGSAGFRNRAEKILNGRYKFEH